MSETKEVMTIGKFGLCPQCGKLMGMLSSEYTMYGLTPNGRYPNRVLQTEKDITFACECGYRCSMVMTSEGLFPEKHVAIEDINDRSIAKLANVIGYVEEREDSNNETE